MPRPKPLVRRSRSSFGHPPFPAVWPLRNSVLVFAECHVFPWENAIGKGLSKPGFASAKSWMLWICFLCCNMSPVVRCWLDLVWMGARSLHFLSNALRSLGVPIAILTCPLQCIVLPSWLVCSAFVCFFPILNWFVSGSLLLLLALNGILTMQFQHFCHPIVESLITDLINYICMF